MVQSTEIATFLSRVPGFSALDATQLADLARGAEVEAFAPDERVVRRGDLGDSMYVVRKGSVRVPTVDEDGVARLTVTLEQHAVFGEIAMLSGGQRTADVIAAEPTEVVVFRRDTIEPLLWTNPPLARFLTQLVRKRLGRGGRIRSVGKYKLVESIGRGASSEVFEGLHTGLNRVVAVKMLSHELAYDRPFRDRFLLEARTVAALDHPNIVRVYDTEAAYATYFIVMERLEGSDLRERMAGGAMSGEEVSSLMGQAARALFHAHAHGILHRDVKPSNCGVDSEGRLKLMDFGVAARVDAGGQVGVGDRVVVGTPRYMPPEVARGLGADGRSDIYSLAVTAFELVSGRPPYRGSDPREVMKQHVVEPIPDVRRYVDHPVPPGLVDFIQRGLAKDPDDRPYDLDEVLDLLDAGSGEISAITALPKRRLSSLAVEYPEAAAGAVAEVLEEAARKIGRLAGVRVMAGELTPARPERKPAPRLPRKTPARTVADTSLSRDEVSATPKVAKTVYVTREFD